MDFSRLHTYTPPQCVPENTGYTYALSSSYSSAALDFETEHKLDPVFDSPRMSRRSLRLAAAGFKICISSALSFLYFSSIFSQSSFNSHASDTSMVSTVLDESLIREQTEVDHFWGLDDDTDPKGSETTLMQGNGEVAPAEVQTAVINGYTCSDCSMLSERKEVLTAYSASHVPSSRIYSRDRSQKHASSKYSSLLFYISAVITFHVTPFYLVGRAASSVFRWLRNGWYQLVTLVSLLSTFLVRRCLPNIFKLLLFLIPLLFLLGRDGEEHNHLLSKVKKLELDLSQMKSELLNWQSVKTSCEKIDVIHEKVDAQVKESIRLMFFGDRQEDFPESLLQWLASNFVSKSDLQTLLQDLELQILKNITLYMSSTNQKLTSEVVTNAVNNVGVSGITEAQARIIVNNALKLYSQDKTGMVDFALESGGGSILSTRCSETYETKTALISLFGIPLWYFSQSPRVVIQPDMYPGNCWAFKGSQGYLVVRLSMKIYPTAFTLEHIPKALSPTGNITSAPKNFSVYGLEDEYQEEGVLLGHYFYDQGGEPLQMFPVKEKNENVFQIVELRIVSNWGHAEYTCLYRFRVHGKPAE
uniref:Sad1 and UNC84 domain containing 1 n=1 Tax=Nothoprocta perdicaria TaxID=30464 RepID=A0A8C6YXY1_NOTPE